MAYKNVLKYSDVTPKADYMNRRQLMGGAAGLFAGMAMGPALAASKYSTDATPNTFEEISSYNNFYEFGTGKDDPARHAHQLTIDPWSVQIDGMVDKPGSYGLEDILAKVTQEERIYRFRCVEAWSMVDPMVRVRAEPTAEHGRCAVRREICGVRDAGPERGNAGHPHCKCRLALSRRSASGRGDAPADHHGHWHL